MVYLCVLYMHHMDDDDSMENMNHVRQNKYQNTEREVTIFIFAFLLLLFRFVEAAHTYQ